MFKYKTEAELSAMTAAERDQYAVDKRTHEAGLTKAQIDAAVAEVEKKIPTIPPAVALPITKEEVEEIKETLNQLKETGNSGTTTKDPFAPGGVIEKALTDALPKLKLMKNDAENKDKELVIKVAINVLTTAVENASGVTTPDAVVYNNISGYAADVRPDQYIINFLDNGRTDKPSLPYMDKLPNEGTMAITDEGELKPLISISFELRYSTAMKIAGRTKVSEEGLDDIPNLMAIIRNELKYEHDIAEQTAVFTKINAIAGAFVAGGMAASTTFPSNYDAIRAAIYGIKIASNGRYMPNAALVPSADAYNMGATKDLNGQYVLPTFVLPDGSKVSGVQVVEVNDDTVAEGSFVVGDFRKLKRRVYKEFTIRIGQGINTDGDDNIQSDFESNMYTIIGESRLHLWVYENEKAAFTKSTFAAVKTAIEAPTV